MVGSTRLATEERHHSVGFYRDAAGFTASVADFVLDGLLGDDIVLVLATPEHQALLDAALVTAGVDAAQLRERGRYVTIDAAAGLDRFMVAGVPDQQRFAASIGETVTALASGDRPLRIFGEMVGVLWSEGNVAAAIEIEHLWNELRTHAGFALHCGYDLDGEGPERDITLLHQVCDVHTTVTTPSWSAGAGPAAPDDDERARIFLPSTTAPRAARRFVRDVLREWCCTAAIDEVEVLVSELATNAVVHAGSPFEVSLQRAEGRLTLRVRDLSATSLARRDPGDTASDGRGLGIVAGLAPVWGVEVQEHGKVVWVELDPHRPISA